MTSCCSENYIQEVSTADSRPRKRPRRSAGGECKSEQPVEAPGGSQPVDEVPGCSVDGDESPQPVEDGDESPQPFEEDGGDEVPGCYADGDESQQPVDDGDESQQPFEEDGDDEVPGGSQPVDEVPGGSQQFDEVYGGSQPFGQFMSTGGLLQCWRIRHCGWRCLNQASGECSTLLCRKHCRKQNVFCSKCCDETVDRGPRGARPRRPGPGYCKGKGYCKGTGKGKW